MSGTGETLVDFAGEERNFRIRLGEIRAIQSKCGDVGIGEILRRLARGTLAIKEFPGLTALAAGLEIHADDVREPIYQGLRGGGMPDFEASRLVRQEIDERGVQGLVDNVAVALVVLYGTLETTKDKDDPTLGESQAGENSATSKNPSTSLRSTAEAKPSASGRAKSTISRRGNSQLQQGGGPKPTAPTKAPSRPRPKSTTR